MTDFFEKLNQVKATVKLGDTRKAVVRANLSAYIASHTLPQKRNQAQMKRPFLSRFTDILTMFSLVSLRPFQLIALIVLVFLMGTAGTAAAAEKSLPGQLLYIWKTGVNEKIQLQLILDEDSKAEFEMTLAARRLTEAEALADRGKLGPSEQELVRAGFAQYSERAQSRVEKLEAENNQEKADKLKQRLSAVIESNQEQMAAVGLKSNASVDSRLNVTDNTILSSQAVVNLDGNSKQDSKTDSEKRRRQADIKKAQELLLQARVKLKAGYKADALELNDKAIDASKKARQTDNNRDKGNARQQDGAKTDPAEDPIITNSGVKVIPKIEVKIK